jgi:[citrate (pro-3S)-lyase] ligase
VETAAKDSAIVHLFILSADKSRFSAADRMAMAKAGTADLPNVIVHPTGDYLISAATFPSYFIKDKVRAAGINCELDLTVFARCFAEPLGIVRRYVGTEPLDEVTRAYNSQMHAVLPALGVEVIEVPRLEKDGAAVSASRLRALLDGGRFDEIEKLAPPATAAFLRNVSIKSS